MGMTSLSEVLIFRGSAFRGFDLEKHRAPAFFNLGLLVV